jgi:two-component system sensor histidine kinase KdpD
MTRRDDDDRRPDPDALLERAHAETSAGRAKLKIWFGASAGAGKTYTMLGTAQRLRREGVDVVVGIVETHGRAETAALVEGLDVLPRRKVSYRGHVFDELDLDAALARRPAVVLLDELAHTNVPGSRHEKRWQDATDLLDAGIEVHATLNVQHIESLNDVIAQITGVRVRETVPDAILERADEIELVDVPPEVVLARLKEGKVYVPDQAARAAAGFFKEGNLHALRELALRLTAERVDAEVQSWRRQQGIAAPWATRERIMVCIGPSPASARIIRSARRMAGALHAPWIAAYVERPGAPPRDRDRARLAANLRLAESLGAEVMILAGERPGDLLLELASQRSVTRIVVGKPTHARWRDFVYGSLVDDLVRRSGPIDIHVISGGENEAPQAVPEPTPPRDVHWDRYLWAALPIAGAGLLAIALRDIIDLADVAMIFLVGIAVAATFFGRGPSLLASVLAVATFDFFFVPEYFTFAVSDFRHVLTFAVMLCAGVLLSTLTERIRQQSAAARARERRTAALYGLTRALSGARDEAAIARATIDQVRTSFDSESVLFVRDPSGATGMRAPGGDPGTLDEADRTVARWSLDHGRAAGRGLETLHGARVVAFPLAGHDATVGVLALVPKPPSRFEDPTQRALLEAFVTQTALAIERAQLAEAATNARVRADTEEMRSSLLSSVSHDLRTPIGSILGAATTLIDTTGTLRDAERTELAQVIRDESSRLARLVANLLDMTRVEGPGLQLQKEWVPLEEVVGGAMNRLDARLAQRAVRIDVARALVAPLDPVLFEQLLVNLLENALKYTPEGSPLEIVATATEREVALELRDRGPGIPPGSEERIFEKFFRSQEGAGGVGLGLAICRGIARAHGGTITARTRDDGGAVFRVTLPIEGSPPALPAEPASESVAETRT